MLSLETAARGETAAVAGDGRSLVTCLFVLSLQTAAPSRTSFLARRQLKVRIGSMKPSSA